MMKFILILERHNKICYKILPQTLRIDHLVECFFPQIKLFILVMKTQCAAIIYDIVGRD
jgi:hypothetical protein